jgi:hypothetical protein
MIATGAFDETITVGRVLLVPRADRTVARATDSRRGAHEMSRSS